MLLRYLVGPRVDEVLALDADQLGYGCGHRTLPLWVKGGKVRPKPVVPLALDALVCYLNGRTDGPLIATRTGGRLGEPEVCGSCCGAWRRRPGCRRPTPSSSTHCGMD